MSAMAIGMDRTSTTSISSRCCRPLQGQSRRVTLACANPRHQHDFKTLKKNKLPAGMILLPGVIDVTTNYLEHPEVVADRICQWVDVVGDRERVVASTDCGFGTFAGFTFVAEDVVWAKLQMLRDGAKLASE